ncbi:hypothetical protein AAC387_Pa01g2063 [Persea americana]
MTIFSIHHPWAFSCGLLGNIISFMVYLSPVPTFVRVYKRKTTEGFQSIPYVVALFSAMMWVYYAVVKGDAMLLITINAAGSVIETTYIALFVIYAPRQARIFTAKLVFLLNVGLFSLIVLLTLLLKEGSFRVKVLGSICVAFSVCVFIAPLSIMRLVIRTKSVEFMPFSLSFFLTLSAVTWFLYGLLRRDYYIAFPNVLGFIFGVIQMILYAIYMGNKNVSQDQIQSEDQSHSGVEQVARLSTLGCSEVHPIKTQESYVEINTANNRNSHEHIIGGQNKRLGLQNEIQLTESEV